MKTLYLQLLNVSTSHYPGRKHASYAREHFFENNFSMYVLFDRDNRDVDSRMAVIEGNKEFNNIPVSIPFTSRLSHLNAPSSNKTPNFV